jgi:1-acyl-sn-glycerol-3-phosphate acyltransferase
VAYSLVRWVFLVLARAWLRFRVVGFERIPAAGPTVIVASHRSWLDPPCIVGACPRAVSFLILDTIYARPWARWLYRAVRAIPVSNDGRGAIAGTREALRRLGAGGVVAVFPEGRVFRDDAPGRLRPGAAIARAPGAGVRSYRSTSRARPRPGRAARRSRAAARSSSTSVPPLDTAGRGHETVDALTARIGERLEELARSASVASGPR